MTARRLASLLTISLAALFGSTAAAQATGCSGDTWYGPGGNSSDAKSGEWGEKSNWSTGAVPVGQTQVCVTVPGTYTVTLTPYPDTHYAGDDTGAAADLTLGASSGSQILQVVGEGSGFEGNSDNSTDLQVGGGVTIGVHGELILDATELDATNFSTTEPHGGTAVLEQDTSGVREPNNILVNEGTIVAETSSSRWNEGIASRLFTNRGSLQVDSGALTLHNDESETSTGTISTAAGAKLTLIEMTTFTNSGSLTNAGTTILNGYPSHARWVQGSNAISGNPVEIQSGGGLEDSATSGAGSFTFGSGGSGYLLGTIPKDQAITLESISGQCTLFLGNDTLVNEGTLHLDVPAGSESNTNIEEGNLVNRGTISGTVEGAKAKNVIDVALTNEPAGVLTASSGTLFANREITNNGLVEIAPSAVLEIVATTLINDAGGAIAPQISSANTFGKVDLGFRGVLEAGGTLAPTLTSGFTPSANEEFDVIEGSPVKGSFATVSGGFTGDYAHESSEPPYVGVVYGASTGTTGTTGAGTGTTGTTGATGTTATTPTTTGKPTPPPAGVSGLTVSGNRVTVKLTCPTVAPCDTITVKVTVMEHLKRHGRTTTKTIVVASGTASLKAGAKATLKLHIDSAGKALLRRHHSLHALATVTEGASEVASEKITLKG